MSLSRVGAQKVVCVRWGVMVCLAVGLAAQARAQVTHWSTEQLHIEFDPSTFSFTSDSHYNGLVDVVPAGYSQIDQGVQIHLNGLLAAYASSYTSFSDDARAAVFNAFFNFTPQAGYAITGYTVTYRGGYFIETPGSVGLAGQSGSIALSDSAGGQSFDISAVHGGSLAPQVSGELSAWAGVGLIEIFDGYQQVYSHDEQVLDYCEPDDPGVCYYRTEPVYVDQPIYRYESDLGEAQIFLNSISVQAQVTAVPEPGAWVMTVAGLVSLACWAGRRRRLA